VYGLEHSDRFSIRYDLPSECARLLHAHETDIGLIPSIEYLRGPSPYWIVPGPAVTSRGPVASVAIFTRRQPQDIRTIAMDTSSRTSVALATILLRRRWEAAPAPAPMAPDLDAMLANADAALIIGDTALFLDHEAAGVSKIDLGHEWTAMTGLPFVYACWTGWPGAVTPHDVTVLQRARDAGLAQSHAVAAAYYPDDTPRQAVARRYLRDNIQYVLADDEVEGLRAFYRYASELDLAAFDGTLRFYDAED
jgi:predicted solute-binding protein